MCNNNNNNNSNDNNNNEHAIVIIITTTIIITIMITTTIIIITIMMVMVMVMITIFQCFPANDELGACRTNVVSPEQPVLCMKGVCHLLSALVMEILDSLHSSSCLPVPV